MIRKSVMENNLNEFKFCHLLYSSGRTGDSVLEESIALQTIITRQEDKKGSFGNGISSNKVSFSTVAFRQVLGIWACWIYVAPKMDLHY